MGTCRENEKRTNGYVYLARHGPIEMTDWLWLSSNELYRHVRMRDSLLTATALPIVVYQWFQESWQFPPSARCTLAFWLVFLRLVVRLQVQEETMWSSNGSQKLRLITRMATQLQNTPKMDKRFRKLLLKTLMPWWSWRALRRTHVAAREGGLRNLQDTTCWRGGQSNQRLWFGVSEYSEYSRWIVLNILPIACAHHILYSFLNYRERSGRLTAKRCTPVFAECHLDAWLIGAQSNAVPVAAEIAPLLKIVPLVSTL